MSSRRLVQMVLSRRLSTTALRAKDEIHPGYNSLKVKQEHFQKEDGKLIHLKGGGADGLLYRFTLGLCFVGVGGSFYSYYILAFPSQG